MTLRRDPSKAMQLGFLALLLVSTVQVGWWMYAHVQYARSVEQRVAADYGHEAAAVSAIYADAAAEQVAALLPQLKIENGSAQVRPEALDEVMRQSDQQINRVLWEGGFFLLVLVGGMTVLTRAIRHDAELRRRQQNFLAAVSHEFKSPLASIQLAAETLVLRSAETDSQRLGRRIIEDGERLLRMIDNLLDTTRLEEGRQQLAPQLTNVHAACAAAIAEIAERARLRDIAVTLEAPADLEARLDPTALETALRNLLDNAFKACVAGKGHSIVVRAASADGGATLSVADDGLGFPPEEGAMIFEKFHRLGDELRRSMPGTGLGLYIVKRLVELSGGSIAAHSEGPGKGATITIDWPGATR